MSASVPRKDQIPYRGRKVSVTQNVMCACSFDMLFTFVYAGWEGTANDSRVFVEAITNSELRFPHPPTGKFHSMNVYVYIYTLLQINSKDMKNCHHR